MKNKIEIIAEVAQGFEGSPTILDLMVRGAVAANADAVKFQLIYADEIATPDYEYYSLYKRLEMDVSQWYRVQKHLGDAGIKLYFDISGTTGFSVAKEVCADGVKVSTTNFYYSSLFDEAINHFDNLILSVGGISINDVDTKLSKLSLKELQKICLIYGFQAEPTPISENNLNKIRLLRSRYPDCRIGFMDHSNGALDEAFNLSLVAMGVGLDVIEKHITLDRELEIEDFISGITPTRFLKFVELIREYEPALGMHSLELSAPEKAYQNKATKSVVSLTDLTCGEIITFDKISLKRCAEPVNENSILKIEDAVGMTATRNIPKHSPVLKGDLCVS